MKLSELRVCDGCRGPLLVPPNGCFYVVRVSQAMVSPSAANRVLGLAQALQGNLGLAEVMGDSADDAIMVLGEKSSSLWTELLFCFDCHVGLGGKQLPLAVLCEAENDRLELAAAPEPAAR